MTLVASLGMYDDPPLDEANDALWTQIAARLAARGVRRVPRRLDRSRALASIWSDPNLLLAQCCGYPLMTDYRDRLRYVATPRYAAPGCVGADHRSRIVVRSGNEARRLADLRGSRAALNDRRSNSGMNLLRAAIAPIAGGRPFFSAVIETGSHRASLAAVADGEADLAAIDAVTFAALARGDPAAVAGVRTLAWSDLSPGLPFVTSAATPPATVRHLRGVLAEVLGGTTPGPARAALLIEGVETMPAARYARLLRVESNAARLGYPHLA